MFVFFRRDSDSTPSSSALMQRTNRTMVMRLSVVTRWQKEEVLLGTQQPASSKVAKLLVAGRARCRCKYDVAFFAPIEDFCANAATDLLLDPSCLALALELVPR